VGWAYYITDRRSCPIPLLRNIQIAIEAGVDFIQIREKDLPARQLFSLVTEARAIALHSSTKILVNDRLDIALAAGLDGIHLGQSSISPSQIRGQVSRQDFLIGISTHSYQEVRKTQDGSVDYITFGPVFFTPSKAVYGNPVGLKSLREVCRSAKIPVFALGGVDRDNYGECLLNGATGVAAIRLFQDPQNPSKEIVREIKEFEP
jgi:thiamine-phosphate pyrophosphorylase